MRVEKKPFIASCSLQTITVKCEPYPGVKLEKLSHTLDCNVYKAMFRISQTYIKQIINFLVLSTPTSHNELRSCHIRAKTPNRHIISEGDGVENTTTSIRVTVHLFTFHRHCRRVLNIMSNFIHHETKKINPRGIPWIAKPLKTMFIRKDRLFKNY